MWEVQTVLGMNDSLGATEAPAFPQEAMVGLHRFFP